MLFPIRIVTRLTGLAIGVLPTFCASPILFERMLFSLMALASGKVTDANPIPREMPPIFPCSTRCAPPRCRRTVLAA